MYVGHDYLMITRKMMTSIMRKSPDGIKQMDNSFGIGICEQYELSDIHQSDHLHMSLHYVTTNAFPIPKYINNVCLKPAIKETGPLYVAHGSGPCHRPSPMDGRMGTLNNMTFEGPPGGSSSALPTPRTGCSGHRARRSLPSGRNPSFSGRPC